jgi:hypothetical protein
VLSVAGSPSSAELAALFAVLGRLATAKRPQDPTVIAAARVSVTGAWGAPRRDWSDPGRSWSDPRRRVHGPTTP